MKSSSIEKLACAYFFVAPSLAYGLFTSRLPAIKDLAGLDSAGTGSVLLALGLATLAGMLGSNLAISRYGAKSVTALSAGLLCFGLILACLALDLRQLVICCVFTGLAVGFCDVGMNALGIELEKRQRAPGLSFLHAFSSIGGVLGALSGAFFAWLDIAPFWNGLLVLGIFCLFWPLAFRRTPASESFVPQEQKLLWKTMPLCVFVLGMLSLLAHVAEGAAAEWGSILLHSVKLAPEDEAALAFACFTSGMVICRLGGDRLRGVVSDLRISFVGGLLGAFGMSLALWATQVWLCLAGFGLMGLGLAPIVPILFSRAGKIRGLAPGRASMIISTFSYTGMLLLPPLLGYLAQISSLVTALWVVVACCVLTALGSLVMRD